LKFIFGADRVSLGLAESTTGEKIFAARNCANTPCLSGFFPSRLARERTRWLLRRTFADHFSSRRLNFACGKTVNRMRKVRIVFA
jgi:hypothetical protein